MLSGAGPFPTFLHIGGYDSTAKELYASAYPALDRGWVFVALDGPGKGGVLYDRRGPQWPDWEYVVPGMFDLVAGLREVDARRIVLVGRSFGGLLAPRGAAGEMRLAALVVDPGQFHMAAGVTGRLGELWLLLDDPAAKPKFDALLAVPAMRTLLGPRMVTNGVADPQTYFQDMRRYTTAAQAPAIACPTFVTDNETDVVSTGQGQRLYDALTCAKAFANSPAPRVPRDTAKGWRPSCSAPRRSTGSKDRAVTRVPVRRPLQSAAQGRTTIRSRNRGRAARRACSQRPWPEGCDMR